MFLNNCNKIYFFSDFGASFEQFLLHVLLFFTLFVLFILAYFHGDKYSFLPFTHSNKTAKQSNSRFSAVLHSDLFTNKYQCKAVIKTKAMFLFTFLEILRKRKRNTFKKRESLEKIEKEKRKSEYFSFSVVCAIICL